MDCTVCVAKTKALISFAVTAKLICVFVFAYAKYRFSHDEAHICIVSLSFISVSSISDLRHICSHRHLQNVDHISCRVDLSRITRKPTLCICHADQFRGNREADQRLCFRYIDSTIPLLSKSEISNLEPSSVAVQPGLCRTRSETRTLVFSWRDSFQYETPFDSEYFDINEQFDFHAKFFLRITEW